MLKALSHFKYLLRHCHKHRNSHLNKLFPSEIQMFAYLERFSMTGDFEGGSLLTPASEGCSDKNPN